MLYTILAYHAEADVLSWTRQEDAEVMERLSAAHGRINRTARLGPAARLGPTRTARTLRGPGHDAVLDGPFAETKEQLLGFYVLECADDEAAVAAARELQRANPGAVYEMRPIVTYLPDTSLPTSD